MIDPQQIAGMIMKGGGNGFHPGRSAPMQKILAGVMGKLLGLQQIKSIYQQVPPVADKRDFLRHALAGLGVSYEVRGGDLGVIPAAGPLVVVANHPFGAVEGLILADLLHTVRADVKLIANYLLHCFPEIRELFIFVDPFGSKQSVPGNAVALKRAATWLRNGGLLGVFPGGEVSHLRWDRQGIADPIWSAALAGLVRRTQAQVLPVFFHGLNGPLFQVLGLIHPKLRTALLPRELLNKKGKVIGVTVGKLLPAKKLRAFRNDQALAAYLKWRTYLLGEDRCPQPAPGGGSKTVGGPPRREPLALPVPPEKLQAEVERLPDRQLLLRTGKLAVFYARASQIPFLLREIGRLRELTFRLVGEGTGMSMDLDRFDVHYLHLFIWSPETREVVGAYRLGPTDDILARAGKGGLYTHTLFSYGMPLLTRITPALELGRSFVRPEYQKNYAALLLLWKGIGHFVVNYPRYRILFGPVSISNDYRYTSQRVIASSLMSHRHWPDLGRLVRPRHPLAAKPLMVWEEVKNQEIFMDIGEMSDLVAELEDNQRGLPILLKHYLKLGGRMLGFSQDPHFGNVLDGLLVVDLEKTPGKVLQRYMGAAGAESFLHYHRRQPDAVGPGPGAPLGVMAGPGAESHCHS